MYEMDCLGDGFRLIAEDEQGKVLPMEVFAIPTEDKHGFDGRTILRMTGFKIEMNIKVSKSLRFSLQHNGKHVIYLKVKRANWLNDAFINGKIK